MVCSSEKVPKRSMYICPRCFYKTCKRNNIQYHFQRQRPCSNEGNIELSDEIKEIVLRDKIYHPPKTEVKPTTINTTNNVTNIQNIIGQNMTPLKKLMRYAEYKEIDIVSLDEDVNDKYANIRHRLKKASEHSVGPFHHELRSNDFHKVIDEISQSHEKDFHDFNIIYDTEMNKISILDDVGEWKESLVQEALHNILYTVQDNYLDEYETYLIRRVKNGSAYDAQCAKELLREYYRFISVFDLPPFCIKDDTNFLPDVEYGSTNIKEEFYPMYTEAVRDVKLGEKKTVQRTVLDIIKRNSAKNIKNLNASICALFSTDNDFQQFMLEAEERNRLLGY